MMEVEFESNQIESTEFELSQLCDSNQSCPVACMLTGSFFIFAAASSLRTG